MSNHLGGDGEQHRKIIKLILLILTKRLLKERVVGGCKAIVQHYFVVA
ncbi:MAG: hypothetical protein IPG70_04740 [Moraxellaceae bacterium]|nr:hypothetical protein [Moraxellaceae bacterium]